MVSVQLLARDTRPWFAAPQGGGAAPSLTQDFYAGPAGTSGAGVPGTRAQPWDLQYALNGADGRVVGGKTVALLSGTYSGNYSCVLNGSSGSRITFCNDYGANALVTGSDNGTRTLVLDTSGSYVDWRSNTSGWLIINHTNPAANSDISVAGPSGIDVHMPHGRVINAMVHDTSGTGIGFWTESDSAELHGNLIYNVGRQNNLDHGIYTQNASGNGQKRIAKNIVFSSFAFGMQHYGDAQGVNNYLTEHNIIQHPGKSHGSATRFWIFKGNPISDLIIRFNHCYQYVDSANHYSSGGGPIGSTSHCTGVYEVEDNWLIGDCAPYENDITPDTTATTVSIQRNTIWCNEFDFFFVQTNEDGGTPGTFPAGTVWDNNTYYCDAADAFFQYNGTSYTFAQWQSNTGFDAHGTRGGRNGLSGTYIFVEPNEFEVKRANIAIYNFPHASTVTIPAAQIATFISAGDPLYIRSSYDPTGTPIVSQSAWDGNNVSVAMTGNDAAHTHPTPTNLSAPAGSFPEFGVFIARST